MSSKLATVIFPTRKRVKFLQRSLDSLFETCSPENINNIEVFLCVDFDDSETIEYVKHSDYFTKAQIHIIVFSQRLGYNYFEEYINHSVEHIQGKWIVIWNDDIYMKSKNWDKVLEEYDNTFLMLNPWCEKTKDYLIDKTMFPIIPRQWVDICGAYARYNHVDDYIGRLATELQIFRNEYRIELDYQEMNKDLDITGNERQYHVRPFPEDLYQQDLYKLKTILNK